MSLEPPDGKAVKRAGKPEDLPEQGGYLSWRRNPQSKILRIKTGFPQIVDIGLGFFLGKV
jgi:hypothetical protein